MKIYIVSDIVVFNKDISQIVLIKRGFPPFKGKYALPGGYVEPNERIAVAAARELKEETGIIANQLVEIGIFDDPKRDIRNDKRNITYPYFTILDKQQTPIAGDDAAEAEWIDINKALTLDIAFDHKKILKRALDIAKK